MLRHALLVGLILVGCKKEKREGLPPAQDWGNPAAGSAQGSGDPQTGAMVPTNPHGGPANPHGGPANPHGGGSMPPGHPGVASGGDPHGQPPPMAEKTAARSLEKRPDGRHVLGPFTLAVPKTWKETPVTSSMRAAHFDVPTLAKAGTNAELIVYYFGPDGAGSDEDNIQRWLDQLQQPDGKATKDIAKIEKATFAGQGAVTISATGKFEGMAMGNTPGQKIEDAMLLAAIVKSPSGPYYFKLTGSKRTVMENQQAFRGLLASLQLAK